MMRALAVSALIAALTQAPSVSHAQMGSERMQQFSWDIIGPARYELRGRDIIVFPEGGKYVVYKDGMKDKSYDLLSDARMRGEYLAMAKPAMKGNAMPMKEKPKIEMDWEMGE